MHARVQIFGGGLTVLLVLFGLGYPARTEWSTRVRQYLRTQERES